MPTAPFLNRDILEPMIEEALSPFDRAEVTRRLEAADLPYGDLNEVSQFVEHPQLAGRDRWRSVHFALQRTCHWYGPV